MNSTTNNDLRPLPPVDKNWFRQVDLKRRSQEVEAESAAILEGLDVDRAAFKKVYAAQPPKYRY